MVNSHFGLWELSVDMRDQWRGDSLEENDEQALRLSNCSSIHGMRWQVVYRVVSCRVGVDKCPSNL